MRSFQTVTLCGHLGQDPQHSVSQGGLAICSFSVATQKKIKEVDKTSWHRVTCFGELAEQLLRAKKGSKVLVYGELDYGEYTDKNGATVKTTKIIASHVFYIPSSFESSSLPKAPRPAPAPTDLIQEPQKTTRKPWELQEHDLDEDLPF